MKTFEIYLIGVMAFLVLSIITFITITPEPEENPYAEGQIIVKFKEGKKPTEISTGIIRGALLTYPTVVTVAHTNLNEINTINEKFGVYDLKNMIPKATNPKYVQYSKAFQDYFVVHFDKRYAVPDVVSEFSSLPIVDYAEPNFLLNLTLIPNDPFFYGDWMNSYPPDPTWYGQWALDNHGGVFQIDPFIWGWTTSATYDADIDAPEAWDVNTGSSEIIVGVIDSGIKYDLSELEPNMWRNLNEIEDNGIDDDGNGYTDDIFGYDFADDDSDPMDDFGHGTGVAAVIGAKGNNEISITGVAWNVQIMALKAFTEGTGITVSAFNEALYYAIMMDAKVVNLSIGGSYYSQSQEDALRFASGANVLAIASAGNAGRDKDVTPIYPANYESPNIISVAATDENDELESLSNWGRTTIDLAAPGNRVLTFHVTPDQRVTIEATRGTSIAAPHVAGAAVLLFSQFPDETYLQIKSRILNNVDPIPSLTNKVLTGGRLNVYNAITAPTPTVTIEFDKDAYFFLGDQPLVRVVDQITVSNPYLIEHLSVNVWSDQDAGGISLSLTETAENSGIFEGSFFLTRTDESSGHRLRIADDGDTIYASYGGETDTAEVSTTIQSPFP